MRSDPDENEPIYSERKDCCYNADADCQSHCHCHRIQHVTTCLKVGIRFLVVAPAASLHVPELKSMSSNDH